MSRHWMPCRVCGAKHTNPMSSSICPPCGAQERERGLSEAREYNSQHARRERLWNVPERARDEYIAMEDNFSPSTVLDFMLAMHPEPED